ncbi:SDR family NAD(P)-dependent oxidoreductase [Pseudofrankia inefficax]|uniref:Short-chain dehydrogenase/reductase SDR n=1 Tax=Pseudofrankia inefficax (strain DSM 45817 / CECT 9037 / DDB 130130 / EuI1c) TaxID=298654 RepID=E3IZQ5_PSEI1|nr:SDR family NAD(P)-dependent oxidoreductase [Pseudofrankia inefficax]ADP83973.1 short-chain dehydrogenase/reductase SDR [Pseudofrankia inefficax]
MDLQLRDKRALVTGSSSGIGRAIALSLAEEGVDVVVHGRDADRAQATADVIVKAGGRAVVVLGDLAEDAAAARAAAEATAAFGGIDILVNNAGTAEDTGWAGATATDWLSLYDSNVASAVRLIGALTPGMRDGGWGRVIQIGSAASPYPLPERAAYSAAKAAMANLTVSLAKELTGTGITANTISPGPTLTDRFRELTSSFAESHGLSDSAAAIRALLDGPLACPSARLVEPAEIAALVALVASPLGASINGANLRIDGGFTPTVN